ncbi:lactam utilization protein LamB [Paenibacillus sp. FSL H8-0548]|uniref:LamB/YcsF family protein n=1 Tax=Paenibacillus sp. FSL H8-0548 TaxID=1920422 RepID=UPI00096CD97E|nr:5-oxoprolinase subunit PxpA [Paenibacillus sp. FSL H8-0548]OMF24375.1 lactam utilization protein LamB [Paenibacillus sp. FSL H8-0548]
MLRVDLNCDMGEGFGVYSAGSDHELMKYITSANIACGFHAGDAATIRRTVKLALANKVAIGAHPGLPDLAGFGRRVMAITPEEAYELTVYQLGAVQAFARSEGGAVAHVKPHGALYNMAAKNRALADAIAEAVNRVDPSLLLFGLAGSELIQAGAAIGLRTVSEVFADRSYESDGSLTPRETEGAVIADPARAAEQTIKMIRDGEVRTRQHSPFILQADTVCVHGDTPGAVEHVIRLRAALEAAGITVQRAGV